MSTQSPYHKSPWADRYLTDGFLPYLMDSSDGWKSKPWVSSPVATEAPALTIDLGKVYTISRIHLHAVEVSDTIPQGSLSDYAMPTHLKIEAAIEADFSDADVLVDYQPASIFEIGPIVMWNVAKTRSRYIRLTGLKTYFYDDDINKGSRIGFSELEVFSEIENVALGKPINSNFEDTLAEKDLPALVDGHNFYGKILPIREWMYALQKRHNLEKQRPILIAELGIRHAKQKIKLNIAIWLTLILLVVIGFVVLIDRIIRIRQVARIKERFAADIHDELGANNHSIQMLSELARKSESQREWNLMHERIMTLTKRTTTAIRYCTNVLQGKGLYTDLERDMRRAAKRIDGGFEHTFSVEGGQWIEQLKPRVSVDLFLFYKEALINICRHSESTHVSTTLLADKKVLHLTIFDDGKGVNSSATDITPPSLKRRAHLMGASVDVESPKEGGTRIHLKLHLGKFKILNKFRSI